MRQGVMPQSCTTIREMAKRNAGKKSWHFKFLINQHPGCKRSGGGSETALLLLLYHPSSRPVPFCSQQHYFGRQIKEYTCCSEFSTLALQKGTSQLSLCCKASLKWKHLTRGKHLSPGAGGAAASGAVPVWSLLVPSHPGGQACYPELPQLPPLWRASKGHVSSAEQALSTPSRLRKLYLYPPML